MAIKCPYCDFIGDFKSIKSWRFRFYAVTMLECPKCGGVFNYYKGISPRKGTLSEFYVKMKPRGIKRRKVSRSG